MDPFLAGALALSVAIALTFALARVATGLTPWRSQHRPTWTAADVLLGLFAYVLAGATVLQLARMLTRHPDAEEVDPPLAVGVGAQVLCHLVVFAAVVLLVRRSGSTRPWYDLGFRRGGNLRALALGSLATLASFPWIEAAASVQAGLWIVFTGEPPALQPTLQRILDLPSGAERAFVCAVVAFFVPFAEELLFRGFVQPVFVRFGGAFAGIAATSVIFAAIHDREVWLPIFAFSCLLGWLYHRTGRLGASTALHTWNNAVAVYLPGFHDLWFPWG